MVSVCMAVYNGAKFVQAQIDSILPQLMMEDELIICDDCSNDNTLDIIRSCHSSNIKVYVNDNNLGVIKTFGKALSCAKGDFIFLCDQDDVWLDGKVSNCIEQLQTAHLVVTDCYIVNNNLERLQDSFFQTMGSGRGFFKNLKKNTYQGCCMVFRREILTMILPFPGSIPMHDEWIGFVAELFYKVKFVKAPLLLYRRHHHTVSPQQAGRSQFNLLKKLSFRFNLIRYAPLLLCRRFLSRS